MAIVPNRVQQIVDRYLRALQKNNIPVKQAVLFGSYAIGDFDKYSDIDIALVSEIFDGNRFEDRGKIRKINLSISSDLEVMPFQPKDFTPADPLVKEILESGVRIA